MSEAGGHGASSVEEVNTAMILISSAFERKPGENLGMFIKHLDSFSDCNLVPIPVNKQDIQSRRRSRL